MKNLEEMIKDIGLDKLPSEYTLSDFKPMHTRHWETIQQLLRLKQSSVDMILELEKENYSLNKKINEISFFVKAELDAELEYKKSNVEDCLMAILTFIEKLKGISYE